MTGRKPAPWSADRTDCRRMPARAATALMQRIVALYQYAAEHHEECRNRPRSSRVSRSFKNQKTEARPTANGPAPIMVHYGEALLTGAQSEKQSIGQTCTTSNP
jgi:hypothetical protein